MVEVVIPVGEAALWAADVIPAVCDEHSPRCNWIAAADAWRYAINNLRLAVESASAEDQAWLPAEPVRQIHGLVSQLGDVPEMWYGNWHHGAGAVRSLFKQLSPWLKTARATMSMPRSSIGTPFPALGRSVQISTEGDTGTAVTLANGYAMPLLGFGVWQIPADGTTYRSVLAALEMGYRHIDTAQGYGNEHEVGRAMRDSGLPRSEICLVTKLSDPGDYPRARQRFEQQLGILGVEYIDIYMLHSPGDSLESRKQAWHQLEELYDEGRIKALGVSNFDVPLLKELLSFARVRPVYLQNKYSIYQPGGYGEAMEAESIMQWLAQERIVMTGYSIIHPAHGGYLSPLEDPHVRAIAERHKRTPSQVLHRWLLQLGAAVIPRSTRRERIRENSDLFSFSLPDSDMRLLNGIASLVKSDTGRLRPEWLEQTYNVQAFMVG